ncbi:hypothetical protein [Tindallia californiensis]|uniref:Uncharacterized protein n=1 Tax=Tindallia californiensis TaxID=159292 RepID=A0A1H3MP25_9FIRM|nr:hypothetical protein [Tindallia californiensis]SDY77849.1 hypothetical protein SAMN05192546_104201 [Tindallia californiensis]
MKRTSVLIRYGGGKRGKVILMLLVTIFTIGGCQLSEPKLTEGEVDMNKERKTPTNGIDEKPKVTALATFGLG